MNVLLSIKPKYVNEIVNGNKRYEFRKSVFRKRGNVGKVYIYASSPVKRIVSGISEVEFFDYFRDKDKGYAIEIGMLELFGPINPKDHVPDFSPPQSFCYTDEPWGRV
jgi:type I restriction enzyme S subunit